MCVKIFVKKMNTMNNNPKTTYQISHENNNAINFEDYYYAQRANADCCLINFICFFCMVTGLYCLFSYNPNVNQHKKIYSNESTGILNFLNKSNNFSFSILN